MGSCCGLPEYGEDDMKAIYKNYKYPIIWIVGGPGAGKMTQGKLLATHYDFFYIQFDELLEKTKHSESKAARELEPYRNKEKIEVPPKLYCSLLREELNKAVFFHRGYFIDGFPFSQYGAEEFERQIGPVALILHLNVCDAELRRRALGYGELPRASRYYRSWETWKYRFVDELALFHTEVQMVMEEFQSKIVHINGHEGSDVVYIHCVKAVDEVLARCCVKIPLHSIKGKRRIPRPCLTAVFDENSEPATIFNKRPVPKLIVTSPSTPSLNTVSYDMRPQPQRRRARSR